LVKSKKILFHLLVAQATLLLWTGGYVLVWWLKPHYYFDYIFVWWLEPH